MIRGNIVYIYINRRENVKYKFYVCGPVFIRCFNCPCAHDKLNYTKCLACSAVCHCCGQNDRKHSAGNMSSSVHVRCNRSSII